MLIRGKAKWTKVTGEPHWGYKNAHKEWSLDVYPEDESLERLVTEGLSEKIKDKGTGKFITFKRKELKADGTPNQSIRVVDHRGEAWNPKTKIGNGSIVNVNFAINEFKKGEKSVAILSMQVWDLVKFEGGEFPTRDDGEVEGNSWAEDAE